MVTQLQPPTTHLPPISKIGLFTPSDLLDALRYLRLVYNPAVRGSRRKREGEAIDREEGLRWDVFERGYALRWLTSVISHVSDLELEVCNDDVLASQYDLILSTASSLLAICAGTAAAGILTRVFSFSSSASQVEVTLRDVPLENNDYSSVGAQTWGGACVLSELIAEDPFAFLSSPASLNGTRKGLRVLELGAGTGLVSLTLAKVSNFSRPIQIVASDFYPSVLTNLRANIDANYQGFAEGVSVESRFLDWESFVHWEGATADMTEGELEELDEGEKFDMILGADIVYESTHARWIRACVKRLLRLPSALATSQQPGPAFHLVIPLRPTHAMESRSIEEVFPLVCHPSSSAAALNFSLYSPSPLPPISTSLIPTTPFPSQFPCPSILTSISISLPSISSPPSPNPINTTPFPSQSPRKLDLGILFKETITCEAGDEDGDEEIVYGLYRIGWGVPLGSRVA